MKPTFFRGPAEFRSWLKQHHATAEELLVGFYKRKSGKSSITWPEAVDQALCYGWIDGLRKEHRRRQLCHPVYSEEAGQRLERHQR